MPVNLSGKKYYEFLTTNPLVKRMRFTFGKFAITPEVYAKVAERLVPEYLQNQPEIKLKGPVSEGATATYDMAYDTLALPSGFDLTSARDQSKFVHECTHIYIDDLHLGGFANALNEAVAYTAEAVFGIMAGLAPEKAGEASNDLIFKTSYALGSLIVQQGVTTVPTEWQTRMIEVVAKSAHYSVKPKETISNGRQRDLIRTIFR
ncbi:MAG: hypothetical protein MUC97_07540 [Bernardetiaceae bacterium]|jgi:hypothetical protein|nr:hypothetical protein [Bernardetiaceae bacterium]